MNSTDLSSRADDVADLAGRLLRTLVGIRAHSLERMPRGSVLVARRLFPSDTVFLSRGVASGIVTRFGGPASHAALLARKLDLPTVVADAGALERLEANVPVLVDAYRGRVILNPSPNAKTEAVRFAEEQARSVATAWRARHAPAVTGNDDRVQVLANVGSAQDCALAAENGADGIGLFRIEQIYLARRHLPSEEELQGAIETSLEPFIDRPIYVRLLDLGGDKGA